MDSIIGNEQAKRALEIALKGKHSIKFIGNEEAGEFAYVAKKMGVEAYAFSQCFCGNFGSPTKTCTCTTRQVRESRNKIALTPTDLTVETVRPSGDKVIQILAKEFGINKEASALLKSAYKSMRLEVGEARRVLKTAKTISKLNGNLNIETCDLAEALQYRPKS